MPKYSIPRIFTLEEVPEFKRLQKNNPQKVIDAQQAAILCSRAIHWLAIFQILWPSFDQEDFCYLQVRFIVNEDLGRDVIPEAFYQQIAIIFKTLWTIQLTDLYPDGDWNVEWLEDEDGKPVQLELVEQTKITVPFFSWLMHPTRLPMRRFHLRDRRGLRAGSERAPKYIIPRIFTLEEVPEFMRFQKHYHLSDGGSQDEQSAARAFCRVIHWLSIFQLLWPPFDQEDFYLVEVKNLIHNDQDREIIPEAFYQQIALILKTFWTIQLTDLYPDGDWNVEIVTEGDLLVQAEIRKRIQ